MTTLMLAFVVPAVVGVAVSLTGAAVGWWIGRAQRRYIARRLHHAVALAKYERIPWQPLPSTRRTHESMTGVVDFEAVAKAFASHRGGLR